MECIYCGAELVHIDTYFRGLDTSDVLGEIFQCRNIDGFECEEEYGIYKEIMREEGFSEEEMKY